MKLTQERLKEVLDYNPETGIFVRKITVSSNAIVGDIAGNIGNVGYFRISIDNKSYLSHRLAWLYIYGYFPETYIDHINRIKPDNRIENLREVSGTCNVRNMGNRISNKSGVKGVQWDYERKKWHVRIAINQKTKHVGRYISFDEAVCARLAAEQCLDWNRCDSNSPAYQYVQEMLKKEK